MFKKFRCAIFAAAHVDETLYDTLLGIGDNRV